MILFKPEMGLLKPGMGPFGISMVSFRPGMGPFRPGMGPLRLAHFRNQFYFILLFLIIRALLKKSGSNPPSFRFWRGLTLGSWELASPPPQTKILRLPLSCFKARPADAYSSCDAKAICRLGFCLVPLCSDNNFVSES